MNRTIYTLYIDIPSEDLDLPADDPNNFIKGDTISRNERTKLEFQKHAPRLMKTKVKYANDIGIDYQFFGYDDKYKAYHKMFREKHPEITHYNIINFYKLHLLYELAEEYDEILYLDFDAVPVTNKNFFDHWDLTKGIAILHNNDKINPMKRPISEIGGTIRSPSAKYFNCKAMLLDRDLTADNNVINTGIIGASKEHLKQLDYWGGFQENLDLMSKLVREKDDSFWPTNIVNMFGWDNETIFSYKLRETDTPVQWLDYKWHYFYDMEYHIPDEVEIVHAINKRFDFVWRAYDRRNL